MDPAATASQRHGQRSRLQQRRPTADALIDARELYRLIAELLTPGHFEPTAEPTGWRCLLCDHHEALISPTPPPGVDLFHLAWDTACDAVHHRDSAHPDPDRDHLDRQREQLRRRTFWNPDHR